MLSTLTPADAGILNEALLTARDMGLGDDGIVDHATSVLMGEAGMSETTAMSVAYDAWHSNWGNVHQVH